MIRLVLTGALLTSVIVSMSLAGEEPSKAEKQCNFSRSRLVNLTGSLQQQTLTASIKGETCRTAEFRIAVTAADGKVLYEFKHPWSDMSVFERCDWAESANEAKRLFGYMVDGGVKSLPSGKDIAPAEEGEGVGEYRLVALERYEALRAQGLPMLCHWTWYEGSVCIVFDKATHEFVSVVGG